MKTRIIKNPIISVIFTPLAKNKWVVRKVMLLFGLG